jgi:hypothetical protein
MDGNYLRWEEWKGNNSKKKWFFVNFITPYICMEWLRTWVVVAAHLILCTIVIVFTKGTHYTNGWYLFEKKLFYKKVYFMGVFVELALFPYNRFEDSDTSNIRA